MRRNLILVTTGAQGNNVVPRISLFFPFQGESPREMVEACHVSIDARELEVSSEQNFRSAGKCGVVCVRLSFVSLSGGLPTFSANFLFNIKTLSNINMVASWNIKRYKEGKRLTSG